MRRLILALTALVGIAVSAYGQDTTHIRVHNKVDMVWNGNYDRDGNFPINPDSIHSAYMIATIGCASGGCSNWDYTVHFDALLPTGKLDSNVASIDTTQIPPDTTWNVFEVKERMELGRMITPYGTYMAAGSNGFDNNWEQQYKYDITDFLPVLKDSLTLRAKYSGWSSGFSVTLDFYFVKGKPNRKVLSIDNVLYGGGNYNTANDFNTVRTPAKDMDIPANATTGKVRVTPTGHGFDNSVQCAEFCSRRYFLWVDGTVRGVNDIWKDDCGMNSLYPQGGTWIYDRANWCPGEAVPIFSHDITQYLNQGSTNSIDIDIESYTWTGNQAPSYSLSVQNVTYDAFVVQHDLAMWDILSPSTAPRHKRHNPTCDGPKIQVQNNGGATITEFVVEYYVSGSANKSYYHWKGTFESGEIITVDLPAGKFDWSGITNGNGTFVANVQLPNLKTDEFPADNSMRSTFIAPDMLATGNFAVRVKTNSRANENHWKVTDQQGMVRLTKSGSAANTDYIDSVNLEPGCYVFEVNDDAGDGMTNWPTNQGDGTIALQRFHAPPQFVTSIRKDFGTQIKTAFTVMHPLGNPLLNADSMTAPGYPFDSVAIFGIDTSGGNDTTSVGLKGRYQDHQFGLYPNPSSSQVVVLMPKEFHQQQVSLSVINIEGKVVYTKAENTGGNAMTFHVDSWPQGVYWVTLTNNAGDRRSEKLVVR